MADNNNLEPMAEFLAASYKYPDFLIDRLLAPSSVMLLYGETGTFKSWLAIELAYAMTTGTEWMGLMTHKAHQVAIVNSEMPKAEYHKRWAAYIGTKAIPVGLYHLSTQKLRLDTEYGRDWVSGVAKAYQLDCAIFDNLYSIVDGNLSKNMDMKLLIEHVDQLREHGTAIVFVHHVVKPQYSDGQWLDKGVYSTFGSSFLDNWIDTAVEIRRGHDDDMVTLATRKARLATSVPQIMQVRFNRVTKTFVPDIKIRILKE